MINNELVKAKGSIKIDIEYNNGKKFTQLCDNVVLISGREALAKSLTNTLGTCPAATTNSIGELVPALYINAMIFGNQGVDGTLTPKVVSPARTTLYGPAIASKPVNSYVDGTVTTNAVFVATLLYGDAVGYNVNEMALQLSDNTLYSMVTYPNLSKTADMQVTFTWTLSFV